MALNLHSYCQCSFFAGLYKWTSMAVTTFLQVVSWKDTASVLHIPAHQKPVIQLCLTILVDLFITLVVSAFPSSAWKRNFQKMILLCGPSAVNVKMCLLLFQCHQILGLIPLENIWNSCFMEIYIVGEEKCCVHTVYIMTCTNTLGTRIMQHHLSKVFYF